MDTANNIYFNKKKLEIYEMLKHCCENVPYYKGRVTLPESIEDFTYEYFCNNVPILDKQTIKDNRDLFISTTFSKDNLICESTTGSEGQPLLCYKSINEKITFGKRICRERMQSIKNLRLMDKSAIFYGYQEIEGKIIHSDLFVRKNTLYLSNFNLTPDKLISYWKELLSFDAKWLMGPPSSIYALAHIVNEKNLNKNQLDYIELRGEFVTKEQIAFIQKVFNCQVANLYGTREFWDVAYAPNNEDLKILDENVFVESVSYNKNLNLNELLITTLVIKSWPLIRYKIGDFGNINVKNINNEQLFYLDLLQGKKTEWMVFNKDVYFTPPMISSLCRAVNKLAGYILIKGYQVNKISNYHLKLKLCCEDKNELLNTFLYNEIKTILGEEVLIEFEFVDYILPEESIGKVKVFIDHSKKC